MADIPNSEADGQQTTTAQDGDANPDSKTDGSADAGVQDAVLDVNALVSDPESLSKILANPVVQSAVDSRANLQMRAQLPGEREKIEAAAKTAALDATAKEARRQLKEGDSEAYRDLLAREDSEREIADRITAGQAPVPTEQERARQAGQDAATAILNGRAAALPEAERASFWAETNALLAAGTATMATIDAAYDRHRGVEGAGTSPAARRQKMGSPASAPATSIPVGGATIANAHELSADEWTSEAHAQIVRSAEERDR